jgi:hypothetical protein
MVFLSLFSKKKERIKLLRRYRCLEREKKSFPLLCDVDCQIPGHCGASDVAWKLDTPFDSWRSE